MSRPWRYLLRMLMFLAAVAAVVYGLRGGLEAAFLVNPALNGLIGGVFLLGIAHNFRQIVQLNADVSWLERFRSAEGLPPGTSAPSLLAPMATMLQERRGKLSLSPMALRSLLDGLLSRLEESRDLSRYMIGLLIFLGLLGTFWGLSQTIGSVGQVLSGLSVNVSEPGAVFETLKAGLSAPLAGMGTAFSSSLFGLSGSLVLGFLDLQAGQAQNRFFNDVEEWLSGSMRVPGGSVLADGDHGVPAYVTALLEQTAESLETLQQAVLRGEEARQATREQLQALNERLAALGDHMKAEQAVLQRLADGQSELKQVLVRLGDAAVAPPTALDDASRGHLRNLDIYVARLIEELITGREEMIRHIRSDIKLLARTIAATSEQAGQR
jgi:hypothetical protein